MVEDAVRTAIDRNQINHPTDNDRHSQSTRHYNNPQWSGLWRLEVVSFSIVDLHVDLDAALKPPNYSLCSPCLNTVGGKRTPNWGLRDLFNRGFNGT
jgi:hypothetical protein